MICIKIKRLAGKKEKVYNIGGNMVLVKFIKSCCFGDY